MDQNKNKQRKKNFRLVKAVATTTAITLGAVFFLSGCSKSSSPPTTSSSGSAQQTTGLSPVYQALDKDFPDPTLLKDGNTYYAYGTISAGFNVPMATSTDNKTYSLVGDALPKLPAYANGKVVTAPTVVKLGNQYVMYVDVQVNGQYVIATATSATAQGPFTPTAKPLISPSMAGSNVFDSNYFTVGGKNYLAYNTDGGMSRAIWITEISADGLSLVGSPTKVLGVSGVKNPYGSTPTERVESPAMMVAPDGTFVLAYCSGDASADNYYTGYATSKSLLGPYTDQGPLLTQENLKVNGPGETSVFVDGSQQYFAFNGWVGEHTGFTIKNGGRYLYLLNFEWKDGHIPVFKTSN